MCVCVSELRMLDVYIRIKGSGSRCYIDSMICEGSKDEP